MLDRGIDLHGSILDIALANPSYGINRGKATNIGAIAPFVDLDLGKLAGLNGATLHASGAFIFGRYRNPQMTIDLASAIAGYQAAPEPVSRILNLLTLEQKLFDGRMTLEAGRTNVYRYFLLPEGLNYFTSFSLVMNASAGFLGLINPSWGGRAAFQVDKHWSIQGGAFEDNVSNAAREAYFGTEGATGVIGLGEVAYRSSFADEPYPKTMEIGAYYNSSKGGRYQKGTGLPYTPGAPIYPAGGGVFFKGRKTVWREADRQARVPKNMAIFTFVSFPTSGPQPFVFDAAAGMILQGFIPGRPLDAVAFQAHYARMSRIEARYETMVQQRLGSTGTQPRNGLSLELNAAFYPTKWLTITPSVQYIRHSDAYYIPFAPKRPSDGFLVGSLVSISLGPLLGTSRSPF